MLGATVTKAVSFPAALADGGIVTRLLVETPDCCCKGGSWPSSTAVAGGSEGATTGAATGIAGGVLSVNAAAAVTIAADADSGGDLMGLSVDHPVSFDRIGWATGNRPRA